MNYHHNIVYNTIAMIGMSETLYDAFVDNLYFYMRSMILLSKLLICDLLPHGDVAQVLRLQPIASSVPF